MSRTLFLAVFSVTFLTQCGALQRTLQIPMRTLGSITRSISATDSEAMEQRAQQVQQRGKTAPMQPAVVVGQSVAAR